jgi:hypothetical protein
MTVTIGHMSCTGHRTLVRLFFPNSPRTRTLSVASHTPTAGSVLFSSKSRPEHGHPSVGYMYLRTPPTRAAERRARPRPPLRTEREKPSLYRAIAERATTSRVVGPHWAVRPICGGDCSLRASDQHVRCSEPRDFQETSRSRRCRSRARQRPRCGGTPQRGRCSHTRWARAAPSVRTRCSRNVRARSASPGRAGCRAPTRPRTAGSTRWRWRSRTGSSAPPRCRCRPSCRSAGPRW